MVADADEPEPMARPAHQRALQHGVPAMAAFHPESSDPSFLTERKSRRGLLALLGAGGAAAVASAIPSRIARAGHDGTNVFHLNEANSVTSPTSLNGGVSEDEDGNSTVLTVRSPSGSGAIHAEMTSLAEGAAIQCGVPEHGPSVALMAFGTIRAFGHLREEDLGEGQALGPGEGVRAQSEQPDAAAVWGESVYVQERGGPDDLPPLGIGVLGTTGTGTGVIGRADTTGFTGFIDGTGVLGESGTGVGVKAASDSGIALQVEGKAKFSTAGNDVVAAGANAKTVTVPAATEQSYISITLHDNPGPRQLKWVERHDGSFTVHFAGGPPGQRPEVHFSYLVVEPGA